MTSFLAHLSREQTAALFPKAQVALALHRHHHALLVSKLVREKISAVDEDISDLLELIYIKKLLNRQELSRRARLQEQLQEKVALRISLPDRYPAGGEEVALSSQEEVGLFALGKGKIYKRSLPQDVEKMLR